MAPSRLALGRPIGLVVATAAVAKEDERQKTNAMGPLVSPTVKRNPSVKATTPFPLRPTKPPVAQARKGASGGAWAQGKRSEAVIHADARMATSRALEGISRQRSL